jgi:hypothetical protein
MAGSCEYGDEAAGSGTTDLVSCLFNDDFSALNARVISE